MNKDYYDGARAAIQVFRESSIEYPIVGRIADLVAAAFEATEIADLDYKPSEEK